MKMSGRKFLRLLKKYHIPCSVLAMKTKSRLETIYALKNEERVPKKYLVAALRLHQMNEQFA